MTDTKRFASRIAAIGLFIFAFFFISAYYIGERRAANRISYEPVMINDTTMHQNITDIACVMLTLNGDTIEVHSNNITGIEYNRNYPNMGIVAMDSENRWVCRNINIDSIFGIYPEYINAKFE